MQRLMCFIPVESTQFNKLDIVVHNERVHLRLHRSKLDRQEKELLANGLLKKDIV